MRRAVILERKFGFRLCRSAAAKAGLIFVAMGTTEVVPSRPVSCIENLKFHRNRLAVYCGGFEELPLREPKHAGENIGGERLNLSIQIANDGIVVPPGRLDVALDLAQTPLEVEKVFVRPELRIVLCDREEGPECAAQLGLDGAGGGRAICVDGLAPELSDPLQDRLFVAGVALYSLDQVRNQIMPSF